MSDAASAGGEPGRGARRTDTADPRRARERAFKILFQADLRGLPADELLRQLVDDADARALLDETPDVAGEGSPPVIDRFTESLVLGVVAHRGDIDHLIGRFARRWAIHRMPVVDRTVLRLGTYELLHESTSAAVVINEAIELAKALSTEDSGRYVNGVLESVRRSTASGEDEQRPSA